MADADLMYDHLHVPLEELVKEGTEYLHQKNSWNLHQQVFEASALTTAVVYVQKHKPAVVLLEELDVTALCRGHHLYVGEYGFFSLIPV